MSYGVWKNYKILWPCKMVKKKSRSKQQVLCTTSSYQLTVETMIEGQSETVQWVMVSTKWSPFMVQCAQNSKFFVTLPKGQGKVKVKISGLVHNFIIPANCWNHDWRSKSNDLMSYGVHKKVFRTHRRMDWRKVLPSPYRPCRRTKTLLRYRTSNATNICWVIMFTRENYIFSY